MTLPPFHPLIRAWFERRFAEPTPAQAQGWPPILRGEDTLIAAPTGSGKTLAAFLVCIDALLRRGEEGALFDRTEVVYVSPLKALSNDIQRNLEVPLEEIREVARELGYPEVEIRAAVRTGDTPSPLRQALVRRPPHILITTPESLYLMLTAERSRETLRHVRTVIIDEIHALVRDKRGSHLALSLERLDALNDPSTALSPSRVAEATFGDRISSGRPQRIGLSATQRPIETIARFLVGSGRSRPDGSPDCVIVDAGHQRDLELGVELPEEELGAVCTNEQWADIYNRLAALAAAHHTTLVFVNTRRLSERVAYQLSQRLGEEQVGAHHGSLSRERRLRLEQRLKRGELRALVATASLELGIDIGTVDLVCQIGSPRSIATLLQRVGRSGHALGLTPKGRLFPTSRDELVECAALIRAVRAGRLDCVHPPVAPLDILAQQIVAAAACEPWREEELLALVRRAAPYAELSQEEFEQVLAMLSEGFATRRGRSSAYLHRDRINNVVSGRRGARMNALTSGGAIPEVADYRVLAEPEGTFVGTVNEDFAVESMAGDIFLLGTTSWRIRRVESGTIRVEDARGAPPTVPFWLGEAPARTAELSEEVADLRRRVAACLEEGGDAAAWLEADAGLDRAASEQIVRYLRATRDSLGLVPTDTDIVFERFFDESGGTQLVVHAPLGGRINKAWGLALRKRFCVTFDFELQAAASDDAIVLSLGLQHSFPLEDAFHFLRSQMVQDTLTQALLLAPMFTTRWRWNATRALAVLRQQGSRKVPPPLQRMRADDLLAAIFPQLAACQENIAFPYELPDHPLLRQTVEDCHHEAMDLDGLKELLQRIERSEVRLHARETTEPSPMAYEILNALPYTYLDDAPLEERRARAVSLRRVLPESARDLGRLDLSAIERVREEAWPQPRDAEELHDALLGLVVLQEQEAADWEEQLATLADTGRAAMVSAEGGQRLWFAAEHLLVVQSLYPVAQVGPSLRIPSRALVPVEERGEALVRALRGQMEHLGPITVAELAQRTALEEVEVAMGLAQLEREGFVIRGRFTPGAIAEQYCDRRLLARIHRYTLDRLRQEIEPVSAQDLLCFLLRWQHLAAGTQLAGRRGVAEAIAQLQGFEMAAVTLEREILPSRIADYRPSWLDELCLSGEVAWGRLTLPAVNGRAGARSLTPSRTTPVALALRADLAWLLATVRQGQRPAEPASGPATELLQLLRARGALFYDEILSALRRLPTEVEGALWELVARGLVTADGFQALRSLMSPRSRWSAHPRSFGSGSRPWQRAGLGQGAPQGRWVLLPLSTGSDGAAAPEEMAEAEANQLLARYGIVFRDLVAREELGVPWREILRALRLQEARGIVRGGRFVAGFLGEQYALPEAVEALRRLRRQERSREVIRVSAVDPLNLVGIITPGPRVPALSTNAVIYRDGLPVASIEAGRAVVRAEGGEEALRTVQARRTLNGQRSPGFRPILQGLGEGLGS